MSANVSATNLYGGGAVYIDNSQSQTLMKVTLISNTSFINCHAINGGALMAKDGNLTITKNSTFKQNYALI